MAASAPVRIGGVGVGVAVTAGYAYWATGLHPFTSLGYLAVVLPVVFIGFVTLAGVWVPPVARSVPVPPVDPVPARPLSLRRSWPWLAILALGCGIEAIGLLLGGRSAGVPTLSTVVDHALRWHTTRWLLFCGWLAVSWPAVAHFIRGRRLPAAARRQR